MDARACFSDYRTFLFSLECSKVEKVRQVWAFSVSTATLIPSHKFEWLTVITI